MSNGVTRWFRELQIWCWRLSPLQMLLLSNDIFIPSIGGCLVHSRYDHAEYLWGFGYRVTVLSIPLSWFGRMQPTSAFLDIFANIFLLLFSTPTHPQLKNVSLFVVTILNILCLQEGPEEGGQAWGANSLSWGTRKQGRGWEDKAASRCHLDQDSRSCLGLDILYYKFVNLAHY